jgi:hypothetical protein
MPALRTETPIEITVGDVEFVLVPNEEVPLPSSNHSLMGSAHFYENNVLTK